MNRLLPFSKAFVVDLKFDPDNLDHVYARNFADTIQEIAERKGDETPSICLYAEDKLILIAGCQELHKGVGELWMFMTKWGREHGGKALYENWPEALHYWIETLSLHRIQASVVADFQKANVMMLKLGFYLESTKWCFGPNKEDINVYARLL